MTRQQASELGLKKYTGGPTCKRGHNGDRYVSTNACLLCSEFYEKKSASDWTPEYRQRRYEMARKNRHQKTADRQLSRLESAAALMRSLGLNLPLTRAEAKRVGSLHYFTGKPCVKGHIDKRHTTGGCHQCGLEFASRNKKWKFEADPDAVRANDRARYAANPERKKNNRREYVKRNHEVVKAKQRIRYKTNPRPKESQNAMNARRRASKLNATPPWTTPEMRLEMKNIYKQSIEMSKQLGVKFQVDHAVPLKGVVVSGLHVPWNLRIITQQENLSRPKVFSEPHLGLAMPLGLGCGATIECYQL